MKKENRKKETTNLVAMIIVPVLFVLSVVTCLAVYQLDMLPGKYFALLILGIAVMMLVVLLLLRKYNGSFRGILGIVLSAILVAGMVFGVIEMEKVHKTVKKITTVSEVKITEISLFVRVDDPAETKKDTAEYNYGILAEQDREVTNKALELLSQNVGNTIKVTLYHDPMSMFGGLLNKDVDAVLYNSALYTVFTETATQLSGELEGVDQITIDDITAGIRELTKLQVETVISKNADLAVSGQEKQITSDETRENNNGTVSSENLVVVPKPFDGNELPEVITVYVTGIDTYGSIDTVSRSDVNILVSFNTRTHQILLLSTPRDYFVPLTVSGGNLDKLTHAGIYGVDCSVGTMEMLYGVPIDYYFRVNFSGFEQIVDALGGVTIENEFAFSSRGRYFEAGEITMDGHNALAYVRDRYDFADGDFARGRNQMKVIKSILEKAMSSDVLFGFDKILAAIKGNFETDAPYELISDLVKYQLSDNPEWNIVTKSAEGWCDMQVTWSIGWGASSVVIPYEESVATCKELLRQVRGSEVLTNN